MPSRTRRRNKNQKPKHGQLTENDDGASWNPPTNDAQRKGALGKFSRPAALVAACQKAPCVARICQRCSAVSNATDDDDDDVNEYTLEQEYSCCPHSNYRIGYFEPKTKPKPGDWLADGMPGESERSGQSYKDFIASKEQRRPSPECQTIYLCNLDAGDDSNNTNEDASASQATMKVLQTFVQDYFQMPCQLLGPLTHTEKKKLQGRINPYDDQGQYQLLTWPIYSILTQRKQQHADAFAVAGVTMRDLYPDDTWSFVLGQAVPALGVGVFSFARYSEGFYRQAAACADGKRMTTPTSSLATGVAWPKHPLGLGHGDDESSLCFNEEDQLLLLRAVKTLAHELLHLFGLDHCVYHECVMNGANGLEETDASPLHLCPICLRKLHNCLASTGQPLDIVRRYKNLSNGMRQLGLAKAASWFRAAADRCSVSSKK